VRCFVVAGFLLTSASRGPSGIAEPLVQVELSKPVFEDDRHRLETQCHGFCLGLEVNIFPSDQDLKI